MLELLVSELEMMTLEASTITVQGQEVALAVVEEFVYLGNNSKLSSYCLGIS